MALVVRALPGCGYLPAGQWQSVENARLETWTVTWPRQLRPSLWPISLAGSALRSLLDSSWCSGSQRQAWLQRRGQVLENSRLATWTVSGPKQLRPGHSLPGRLWATRNANSPRVGIPPRVGMWAQAATWTVTGPRQLRPGRCQWPVSIAGSKPALRSLRHSSWCSGSQGLASQLPWPWWQVETLTDIRLITSDQCLSWLQWAASEKFWLSHTWNHKYEFIKMKSFPIFHLKNSIPWIQDVELTLIFSHEFISWIHIMKSNSWIQIRYKEFIYITWHTYEFT